VNRARQDWRPIRIVHSLQLIAQIFRKTTDEHKVKTVDYEESTTTANATNINIAQPGKHGLNT